MRIMENTNIQKRLLAELSIGTYAYQMRASNVVEAWLQVCPQPKTSSFSIKNLANGNETEKITVRVKEFPPSLQLIHYPEGGKYAAKMRISEKLFEPADTKIVTVGEKDLTRETIIVTLEDATMDEILGNGLLAPEQIAQLLATARETNEKLFIAINRFLIGTEMQDNQKIPFHLIEQGDEKTWGYLRETLALA